MQFTIRSFCVWTWRLFITLSAMSAPKLTACGDLNVRPMKWWRDEERLSIVPRRFVLINKGYSALPLAPMVLIVVQQYCYNVVQSQAKPSPSLLLKRLTITCRANVLKRNLARTGHPTSAASLTMTALELNHLPLC